MRTIKWQQIKTDTYTDSLAAFAAIYICVIVFMSDRIHLQLSMFPSLQNESLKSVATKGDMQGIPVNLLVILLDHCVLFDMVAKLNWGKSLPLMRLKSV